MLSLGSALADTPKTKGKALRIINGHDDTTQAVGAFVNVNGESFCTGTLVSPTAVITAAHCFEFGLDGDSFFIGADVRKPDSGTRISLKSVHLHPDYMDDEDADIAVAILSQPAPVAPLAINVRPMDQAWVDRNVVFVGYGLQNLPPRSIEEEENFQAQDGTRKAVEIPIVEIMPKAFKYASRNRNTCFGDSGGPALAQVDGKLSVIGVTSWGDDFCAEFGVNTRVDTYLSFVSKYVKTSSSAATPEETDVDPQESAAQPASSTSNPEEGEIDNSSDEETSTLPQDRPPESIAGAPGCAAGPTSPATAAILLFLMACLIVRRRRVHHEN